MAHVDENKMIAFGVMVRPNQPGVAVRRRAYQMISPDQIVELKGHHPMDLGLYKVRIASDKPWANGWRWVRSGELARVLFAS